MEVEEDEAAVFVRLMAQAAQLRSMQNQLARSEDSLGHSNQHTPTGIALVGDEEALNPFEVGTAEQEAGSDSHLR